MSQTMTLEDYLAAGGRLSAPDNAPPRYRGELMRLMATFVDSELAGSAGFADAINHAPGVKERIAAARIVLEKTDHAERVLAIMGSFGADIARYAAHHPWAARLARDADIGASRQGGDMRLSVFQYPLQGWIDAVTMNVLMGLAVGVQLEEFAKVSYAPLAEVFREIAPRERRHAELGLEGLAKIVASEPGRIEVRDAIAYWRPRVSASFGAAGSARFATLKRFGLRHQPNEALLAEWSAKLDAALGKLGLAGAWIDRHQTNIAAELTESFMTALAESAASVRQLESYICGQWARGARDGALVRDAATGEAVASVDSSGLDFAAALAHARQTGGPALRKLSFHERAAILKALAQKLTEQKEEFYALSYATGATRADSWIDIEGGIGTLAFYASRGRRDLPNTSVLVDGGVEGLSRDDSFSAQHILTPLTGAAIHINAFNFPCWGMLEKLAPTLIAGMPAIVKPASQTAYLTELIVRRIIEAGVLPQGALQLVCGSVGDLIDHVDGQDVVTFTGSADTGRRLRSHPAIVNQSVRFNMEADSLNAAILGADAGPGSEEFDLFVKEVVREMTAKAGQKCTAIRRILVPRAACEAVAKAIGDRFARTTVGDPRDEVVRMGALASLAQRDEVRARIRELRREAEIVAGDPDNVRIASGDAVRGAFLNPVLLYCDRPASAGAPHAIEAFGPVATLMPHDSADEAIALARRGKGSLVASVFTNDAGIARQLTLGLAAFHGRVLIGNRASAKSSTGHGSPLPALVHGGPGRAGGGEELGGMRSVKHYMQRTAIQATPRLLGAVTGRWMEGAPTREGAHPFRKSLAELSVGDRIVTAERAVTLEDIEHFAGFTGDTFYAHMDEAAAKANPLFGGRVAHGYLIVSFAAGLFVDPAPGPVLANYGVDNLRFLTPVKPGDTLRATLTAKEINPRASADHGEVRWDCKVTNQEQRVVARYDVLTMVAKTWP